jgi:aryl-alcohol dehydrogenase-like predicted oxidoreductase
MEYRTLGRTGVRVSTYALGTMMFGADGNTDEKECISIVHAALDAGVNLIDTADTYSHGESEEIVGKAIAGRRDEIVLASKVRLRAGDGPNEQGAARLWIMRQIEASLKRPFAPITSTSIRSIARTSIPTSRRRSTCSPI